LFSTQDHQEQAAEDTSFWSRADRLAEETKQMMLNFAARGQNGLDSARLHAHLYSWRDLMKEIRALKENKNNKNNTHKYNLENYGDLIDRFARTIQIPRAVEISLFAWYSIAVKHPNVAFKAHALLDSQPVRRNVRHRRMMYNAVLLVWMTSKLPVAPHHALKLLEQMEQEGRERNIDLVDEEARQRVLTTFALSGEFEAVSRLWDRWLRENKWRPNAHSYQSMIGAHRVAFRKQGANCQEHVTSALSLFYANLQDYAALTPPRQLNMVPRSHSLNMLLDMSDPSQTRELLEKVLLFENNCIECKGALLNADVIWLAMNAYIDHDSIEEAESLLEMMLSLDRIQPDTRHFGIVMNGYARRKTLEALEKVRAILTSLEEQALRDVQERGANRVLKPVNYGILMKAHISTRPTNSVDAVRLLLERMKRMAIRLNDQDLQPTVISYVLLMQAITASQRPGFENEVHELLHLVLSEPRFSECHDHLRLARNFAMDAWAKSESLDAPNHAEKVFASISQPNRFSYNTLLNIYAKQNCADKTLQLLRRFQAEPDADNRPDNATYRSVLSNFCKSKSPVKWDIVRSLFEDVARLDSGCRLDHATVASFFRILEKCPTPTLAIREFLTILEAHNFHHNSHTLMTLTQVFKVVNVEDNNEKSNAFEMLIAELQKLGPNAEPFVYREMLYTCSKLVWNYEKRCQSLVELFKLCANSGNVSPKVLTAISRLLPSNLLEGLLPKHICRWEDTPTSWRRNIKKNTCSTGTN
jgi:pentatricopeptide repeat protein